MSRPTVFIYLFNIREGLSLPGSQAGTGGIPTQMAGVIRELIARNNVDVVLVTNDHFELPGAEVRVVPGLTWHPRIARLLRPVLEWLYRFLYRGTAHRKVALFTIDMPAAQVRAARDGGCRIVGWVNADSVVDESPISKSMAWVTELQRGLASADEILTLTNRQAVLARDRWGGAPKIVHGGAPELPVELLDTPQEYALWVGRMVPAKRPEVFLQLAHSMPDRQFVMVVSVPEWDQLGDDYLAHEASRTPNLTILKNIAPAEMPPIYAAASVLVVTSASEGLPRVILEAAVCGVETVSLELNPDGMLDPDGVGVSCEGDYALLQANVQALLSNSNNTARRNQVRARILERYPLSETVAAIEDLAIDPAAVR